MKKAVLGMGSNLGDRENNLAEAFERLEKLPGVNILAISSIYETEPFDVISKQENYLNCCVLIETELEPLSLLEKCNEIENALLRIRTEYHSARTLDIDILLYEGFESSTEKLTVPHRGIRERAFVLVPLCDLFHAYTALGFDFKEAFEKADKSKVWLYV